MRIEQSSPVSKTDQARVCAWVHALVGQRVVGVTYRNSSGQSGWPDGHMAGTFDEIDQGVSLVLSGGESAVVLWSAAPDWVTGLDVHLEPQAEPLEILETRVDSISQWSGLLGQRIVSVGFAWHSPNGEAVTPWAVRLSLELGSVTIALAELDGDRLAYYPEGLLVIFDEQAARSFKPFSNWEDSYGVDAVCDAPQT